jgi:HlyD family secretion protein
MDQGIAGALAQVKTGRHRGRLTWRISGVAALLLLIASTTWLVTTGNTSVRYITAPISRGEVTRAVSATGTVNPVLTIIVGTYVSGVIQQVLCDYNTQVKEGQVCAKIDPRPYQAVVDQAKANLDVAKGQLEKDKANLGYAAVNYARNAKLAEHFLRAIVREVRSLRS